jgi:hypothetical protein
MPTVTPTDATSVHFAELCQRGLDAGSPRGFGLIGCVMVKVVGSESGDRTPNSFGGVGHVEMRHTEGRQRVDHCALYRWSSSNRS